MTDRRTLLTAEQTRLACRGGRFSEQTSGLASGFARANLVVLPRKTAGDFLLFWRPSGATGRPRQA